MTQGQNEDFGKLKIMLVAPKIMVFIIWKPNARHFYWDDTKSNYLDAEMNNVVDTYSILNKEESTFFATNCSSVTKLCHLYKTV